MKRLLALLIAIAMMFTLALSATAAEFVESITNKGAPELVIIDKLNGKDVVGFITDPNGNKLTTEYLDCLIITSIAEALQGVDMPEDAKEELLKVFEELKKSDLKLSDICPALTDIVKEKWGKDKSADDLVIKDLFDLSDVCDDIGKFLPEDGSTLDLTFDIGIKPGSFVAAMVYVDGKWVPVVDCVNNGDGTITVKFDQICPVAFLVPGEGSSNIDMSVVSPTTSDTSGIIMWSAVMLTALAAIFALVIYRRRVNG